MKNKNGNNFIIKSPKLKATIVENVLILLFQKDFAISELLFELQRRLHSMPSIQSSCRLLRKYLVYMTDCDLIVYDGQRQVYSIKDNGLDLLNLIFKEKERLKADSEHITIIITKEI
jgi:hypothetical protein